jgi:hypothetical protein
MKNEKSIKIHQEIYSTLYSKNIEKTIINDETYYRFDEINNLKKYNKWGEVDKNFKEFVAEKILKICMQNKFIFITGTSLLPVENDNVVSFSTFARGSIEIDKEEMRIYRYALRSGVKKTGKGQLFNCGSICFNPHDLKFHEQYSDWISNEIKIIN